MKYREQLNSPLWQKKRLEIMNRDQWKCRICHRNSRQLHVHHSNGYKNGKAPWEYPDDELMTLCDECHRNQHDPKPLKIYLAGKIYSGDWRNQIIKTSQCRAGAINNELVEDDEFWKYEIAHSILEFHTYVGPFFVSCDHGCYHGPNSHGVGSNQKQTCECASTLNQRREMVLKNSSIQIRKCDLLFAWIESDDCYGTLAEIGFAHALRKPIFIGLTGQFDNLWFALEMAFEKPKIWDSPLDAMKHAIPLVVPSELLPKIIP